MPNVLCTPHLGASTEEAQTNVAVEAAELLIDFFTTGAIKQSVNMSPLDPKTLEALRGYLNVAYRLGLLLAQVDHCPPVSCRLALQGRSGQEGHPLALFRLCRRADGIMPWTGVNIVNAEVLLRERGIELVEERNTDIGDFSSMITAEVMSEERTSSAAGTLFGNNMPRLVQKDGCRLESYLDGTLMIFVHRDLPGVIGRVGGVFGKLPGEHRPDVGRPADEQARRRGDRRAGPG